MNHTADIFTSYSKLCNSCRWTKQLCSACTCLKSHPRPHCKLCTLHYALS